MFWSGESFSIAFALSIFALLLKNNLPWGWKLQVFSILDAWFFLLTPFNSFWKLGEVSDMGQLCWIFLQNILNVFLLFPLIFQLLYLLPNLRKTRKVILFSFLVSLGIECTQLVLDFFLRL